MEPIILWTKKYLHHILKENHWPLFSTLKYIIKCRKEKKKLFWLFFWRQGWKGLDLTGRLFWKAECFCFKAVWIDAQPWAVRMNAAELLRKYAQRALWTGVFKARSSYIFFLLFLLELKAKNRQFSPWWQQECVLLILQTLRNETSYSSLGRLFFSRWYQDVMTTLIKKKWCMCIIHLESFFTRSLPFYLLNSFP